MNNEIKRYLKFELKNLSVNTEISRNSKGAFVTTLIFAITQNVSFQNVNKLTQLINFTDKNQRQIKQNLDLLKKNLQKNRYSRKYNY